ncbi:SDR family oxidoreductase [Actinomadura algeriensis]|uniref:NAD(P)-dependent dehydrogenase (Short-subunit alcohol dehydrogenase family) n=1 Tax=Actinomadura algeriensis TaxID=1679523 RepID=A0ABR9K301_9ACTN|nr:SDR family oxidoreductase [Actinomadura algeriensis]MBE1536988.1 NAD(P)-dependent dehydrogenase (short-subunit alcohol dehydrogenase family) [Actinomadura algeriensis]
MQEDLTGRTAVVTGGASGIGAAIARRWVAAGGNVLIGDIDERSGAALTDELGPAARFVRFDVTSEADHAAACDLALDRYGALDAFFANAGAVGATGSIEGTRRDEWDATVALLLTGAFLSIKHAVRVMRPRGRGAIVCTGSVASVRGGLGPHAYTAAKHGLLGLVESAAVEIGRHGLRVNCVAPGGTVSALAARLAGAPDDLDAAYARLAAASSSGVPTTADDVAAAALFLAGPGAARINGTRLVVDGGDDVPSAKGLPYYAR